jgi:hypothetical protein
MEQMKNMSKTWHPYHSLETWWLEHRVLGIDQEWTWVAVEESMDSWWNDRWNNGIMKQHERMKNWQMEWWNDKWNNKMMELWIDIEIEQWMEHQIHKDKCITSFILMSKVLFDILLLFLAPRSISIVLIAIPTLLFHRLCCAICHPYTIVLIICPNLIRISPKPRFLRYNFNWMYLHHHC